MTTQQPEALRLAEMLTANEWPGHVTLVSYARECVAELRRQHARITELESQLAQRFDAADMATASAQGFRDGVAAPQPALSAGWRVVPITLTKDMQHAANINNIDVETLTAIWQYLLAVAPSMDGESNG